MNAASYRVDEQLNHDGIGAPGSPKPDVLVDSLESMALRRMAGLHARGCSGDDVSQCMCDHCSLDAMTPVKDAEQDARQRIANDDIRDDRNSERYSHHHRGVSGRR